MKFDFFIAYASPDRDAAEELSWQLQDLDRVVFLDKADIELGAAWDAELSDALGRSRVVVVLVSSHSAKAHYQREEIARAVKLARDDSDGIKVVPVMLPGATSAHIPYGLSVVQSVDANTAGGLKRVARKLNDLLPLNEAEQIQLRRNAYYALGAALRLDRVKQWNQILEASQVAENALFLFHGPHDQNVGLFLERIQRFFSQELTVPHRICRVRFNIQGQTPRTGTDWLAHIRDALQCTGPLGSRLRQMVQQQPLFIILGQNPLPADRLADQHIDALREFIIENLPSMLREARLLRGIGVMLALDYEVLSPPDLITKFEEWGAQAEATNILRFRPLPQASLPSWDDVNDYLTTSVKPRPQADQIALIRQEYDRRASNPELTFEKLARLIDRYTLSDH
jgi:TIR domain